MTETRVFFDTNVLVYAHDEDAINHTDSATLLEMALKKSIQGVIAEQNVIELYRVLTNVSAMKGTPLTPKDTYELIQSVYLSGQIEILYPTLKNLEQVLQLAVDDEITSARIFDTRLAALVISSNINYFATYNTKHFQKIEGLLPLTAGEVLKQLA
jgi:predicted nucleic acid-binding protein